LQDLPIPIVPTIHERNSIMTPIAILGAALRRAARVADEQWVARLVRAPLKLIPAGAVMRVLSGPNRGLKWIKGSYVNGCWVGNYEADKVDAFVSLLRPDSSVWDVGANVGYYALVAARRCPRGCVVAIEPLPRDVAYLKRHLALNQLEVHVIDAALGTEDGLVDFDTATSPGSGRLLAERQQAIGAIIQVHVRRTSSLLTEGYPPPDVVKMDIEGAEASVLPALLAALPREPAVLLAVHDDAARRACIEALQARSYTVVPLDGRSLDRSGEWLCTPAASR